MHRQNNKDAGDSADEQGLGKTIQALALIVSEEPTREDAAAALADAQREQNAMALHPESAQARAARAAGIGISPVGRSADASSSAEDSDLGAQTLSRVSLDVETHWTRAIPMCSPSWIHRDPLHVL